MKFNFPKKTNKENIQFKLSDVYIRKARTLAAKHECTSGEIYETLITEAFDEYEKQFGEIGVTEKKPNYSHKRDLVEAGDNRRKEVEKLPKDWYKKEVIEKKLQIFSAKITNPGQRTLQESTLPDEKIPSQLATNCIQCGMLFNDEFKYRRSKITFNKCDACDGSKDETVEDGYTSSLASIN